MRNGGSNYLNKSANCSISGKGVYQPGEEELSEAVAILVECGAARQVDAIGLSGSSSGTWNLAWNFGRSFTGFPASMIRQLLLS